MSKCETCARNVNGSVPMAALENERAQANVDKRRHFIIILVLIALLFGSNLAWLIYEKQFETVTESIEVTQESERGFNSYIGNDGDIYNGETDYQEDDDTPCP